MTLSVMFLICASSLVDKVVKRCSTAANSDVDPFCVNACVKSDIDTFCAKACVKSDVDTFCAKACAC